VDRQLQLPVVRPPGLDARTAAVEQHRPTRRLVADLDRLCDFAGAKVDVPLCPAPEAPAIARFPGRIGRAVALAEEDRCCGGQPDLAAGCLRWRKQQLVL